MGLFDFFKKKGPQVKGLQDLDAMLNESIAVKFQGKTHIIKSPTNEAFYRFSKNMLRLQNLKEESISSEEFIQIYSDIIIPIVPTMTTKDIKKLNVVQANTLFNLIVELVLGKKINSNEEKKSPTKDNATQDKL